MLRRGEKKGHAPSHTGPNDVQAWVASYRDLLASTAPRLQTLLQRPAAMAVVSQLQSGLLERFTARAVKFVAGGAGLLTAAAAQSGSEAAVASVETR